MSVIFKYFWVVPVAGLLLHLLVLASFVVVPGLYGPHSDTSSQWKAYFLTAALSVGSGVLTPLFWYQKPPPPRELTRTVTLVVLLAILFPVGTVMLMWVMRPSR